MMTNDNGRSDIVTIFTAFFALLGTIFTAVIGYKMAELSSRTAIVAEQGTVTLNKLETVHKLVNSGLTTQMKLTALALRRVATLSGTEEDIALAKKAEDTARQQEESTSNIK
jgi:hypothetical protein